MKNKGLQLSLLLIVNVFISALFAQSEVVFYSQSSQVAKDNETFFTRHFANSHHLMSLTGEYNLIDEKSGEHIGSVHIPSVFHRSHPFTFMKSFQLTPQENVTYWLHFRGLNGWVKIDINKHTIFTGSSNFLPLKLPVSHSILKDGTNSLKISVHPWNLKGEQLPFWIPINLPRIDNGISGNIYLEVAPSPAISFLDIQAEIKKDSTKFSGKIGVRSTRTLSGEYSCQFQIMRNGKSVVRSTLTAFADSTKKNTDWAFEFKTDSLQSWSPALPHLYTVNMRLMKEGRTLDEITQPFALKRIAQYGKNLLVNDSKIKVNGINYIYQNKQGVSLPNKKLILEDLEQIKSKGFNTVRIGFYPGSEMIYHLTDSLGLLCFQDLPIPFLNDNFLFDSARKAFIERYVNSFILLARKHSSIVGIGVGHSYKPLSAKQIRFLKDIRAKISSRTDALSYQCAYTHEAIEQGIQDIYCLELLERNHQELFLSELESHVAKTDKPLIFSGLSKAISYRVDSSAITHDLRQMTELYLRLNRSPWNRYLTGQFALTFSDYYLETPSLQAGAKRDHYLNTLGIYTLNRKLKKKGKIAFINNNRSISTESFTSEKQNIGTFVFIFVGLINFLVFLLVYRSLLDFRHNVHRSIRRSHGFFVDLQERRLIPYGESLFLMLVTSVNGGVMIGSIFYFFRNNLIMDYLLSLLFHADDAKILVATIIWKPFFSIPILAIIMFILLVILAFPIQFFSLFKEHRVHMRQALAASAWAGSPFVLLLPIGLFFYNLLLVMNSYWILLILLLYFHIWYITRWINGTRVLLESPYSRVFLISIFVLILVGGTIFFYLQKQINFTGHLDFLFNLYRSVSL